MNRSSFWKGLSVVAVVYAALLLVGGTAQAAPPALECSHIGSWFGQVNDGAITWMGCQAQLFFDRHRRCQQIYFMYARNLANGFGFVYNIGGERVEGFTSLLWTAISALAFKLSSSPEILLLVINILLVSLGIVYALNYLQASHRDGETWQARLFWSVLFLVFLFTSPRYVVWNTITLMENALWSTLLLVTTVFVIQDLPSPRAINLVFLPLSILLLLARPESLLWVLVFLCVLFLRLVFNGGVFNHTGEGNQLGPTLSFRGVDNSVYYRLDRRDKRLYGDYSGCGNCLEMQHPAVMRLIADSLRYWVQAMHVDGFRFDLAPVLGRDYHAFNRLSPFFQILHQDPVLSQVKLIAEPCGIWAKEVFSWAISHRRGASGMAATATRCATSGAASQPPREILRRESAAATICSGTTIAARCAASISSPVTTAFHCATWSATTRNATRPMARTTGTRRATTAAGIAAWKVRRPTRQSCHCGNSSNAISC